MATQDHLVLALHSAPSQPKGSSRPCPHPYPCPCLFTCLNTGTPLQNSLEELRALLEFLMPSLFIDPNNPDVVRVRCGVGMGMQKYHMHARVWECEACKWSVRAMHCKQMGAFGTCRHLSPAVHAAGY